METDLLMLLGGFAAGAFGALLGLGGGVLIVPLLAIGFDVPLSAAVGTSLVSVVATSAGAAAVNVRARRADVRLGITLALGTIVGAAAGGAVAGFLPEPLIAGGFAALMAYTALAMLRSFLRGDARAGAQPAVDPAAADGPDAPAYRSRRSGLVRGGSVGIGVISSLLGVGGGIVAVPLMRLAMGTPMAIAAATSNYVIGVTAAAGAYAYLLRGTVDPRVAGLMVLGVTAGAIGGARVAPRMHAGWLTVLFAAVVAWVAYEMALRAFGVAG